MNENKNLNKWQLALGDVYDRLCELERSIGNSLSREDIMLLSGSIERCKYWKQPEFDSKFDKNFKED